MSAVRESLITPMLGADPEFFLKRERKSIPAFGLIGGTKKNPLKMDFSKYEQMKFSGSPAGFFYQEDGAALEFNIPPSSSYEEFLARMAVAGLWVRAFVGEKGLTVSSTGHLALGINDLKEPQAMEIGCVADMCAYLPKDSRVRDPITAEQLGRQRFAGGHIHVQFNHELVPKHVFVKLADLAVMLPGVILDKQGRRRNFYGRAGIYRDKPYGVELRGPSNMWALRCAGFVRDHGTTLAEARRRTYSMHIIARLFRLAAWTNDPQSVDQLGDLYTRIPWSDVQQAINSEDEKMASQLMQAIRANKRAPYNQVMYLCDNQGMVI